MRPRALRFDGVQQITVVSKPADAQLQRQSFTRIRRVGNTGELQVAAAHDAVNVGAAYATGTHQCDLSFDHECLAICIVRCAILI